MIDSFINWWFKPHRPLILRCFEVFICFSMAYYFSSYFHRLDIWIGDGGYRVSAAATSSHYLDPPPSVPDHLLTPVAVVFYLLCFTYLYSICSRHKIASYLRRSLAFIFFCICVYVQALDQPSAFTVNRMFIVSFFVLSFQPSEMEIQGKNYISGWIIRFFQLTLILQYSTSGICKSSPGDWILWDPFSFHWKIVWTQSQGHYKTWLAAQAVNDLPFVFWGIMALFSYLFELGAVVWFGWKRTRYAAIIFGLLFHLGIATLMKDLIYFSLQMLTSYIFYVEHKHALLGLRFIYQKLGKDTTEIDEELKGLIPTREVSKEIDVGLLP
jgi:hypothetical protein